MNVLRCLACLSLAVVIGAAGCKKEAPRAQVSGEIKYLGKPLTQGTVTFVSESANVVANGKIENGRYTIERAPIGAVKIGVVTPPPPSAMQQKQKVPGKTAESSAAPVVPIPTKYGNPDNSGLTYTVTEQPTQTHDIGLK